MRQFSKETESIFVKGPELPDDCSVELEDPSNEKSFLLVRTSTGSPLFRVSQEDWAGYDKRSI